MESTHHLFFAGDVANAFWSFIKTFLRKPRVHGLHGLVRAWLSHHPRSLLDCIRLTLLCCGLWEVWSTRNKARFENKSVNWRQNSVQWLRKVLPLIPAKFKSSVAADSILKDMDLPPRPDFHHWRRWEPGGSHVTINIGLFTRDNKLSAGVVWRDAGGNLIRAVSHQMESSTPLQDFAKILTLELDFAKAEASQVSSIQSSSEVMLLLIPSSTAIIPWNDYKTRTNILQRCENINLRMICPVQNTPALIMASNLGDQFHRAFRHALTRDRLSLHHQCIHCSFDVSTLDIVLRDDIPTQRRSRVLDV